ncbi:fused response regulator/phosphatase [Sinisalibacter aestuarii]|uniref:Fused response regulator/phosphatase n=2 Tax=Sinisalibacter aestuarii TaxID=2949426 RepID=A0ABQ5LQC6_9RHOB|nr:fused response regulator/phosphatase [Sinisalibacter aestuarii]
MMSAPQTGPSGRRLGAIHRVLVVDDSRAQRLLLASSLTRQGFSVAEAASGDEAYEIAKADPPDLILSDWMMPGMDGLALCRRIRALGAERYIYFILMTSKTEKGAVAQGLDVGADDFLTKPVNADELLARISAGDRILTMERELSDKNRLISSTLQEISGLYDALDRDLFEARKMQQALLRERHRDFGPASVSLLLKPSGHVGGDLVGFFRAGADKVAMFSIDVSGHGIASALLTARLASYLSDGAPEQNIALVRDTDGRYIARPPQEVATLLNILMLEDMRSDLYFTFLIGYLDLRSGIVDIAQCGHPNPALLRPERGVEYIGESGMPVGLLDDAAFSQWQVQLRPGERLLFYSDGFTECTGHDGQMLDESGFVEIIQRNRDLETGDFLEALVWDLDMFCGAPDFPDDLSCAMITWRGAPHDQPK